MVTVNFTPNLQRYTDCSPLQVEGQTVRDILEAAFAQRPILRGYVLDDQHALRKHMVIFINDQIIRDRKLLTDEVPEGGQLFVMQALSGG